MSKVGKAYRVCVPGEEDGHRSQSQCGNILGLFRFDEELQEVRALRGFRWRRKALPNDDIQDLQDSLQPGSTRRNVISRARGKRRI